MMRNKCCRSFILRFFLCTWLIGAFTLMGCAQNTAQWLHYQTDSGKQKSKKIVLISGDEEYRSEESMPMLAKILNVRHGFETVVLFAIDPKTGQIDPEYTKNIPGLNHLEDADLLILATRFRELPDEQMQYIDAYLKAGKPVIGLRTATHAFNYAKDSKSAYKHYAYNATGEGWQGGFGRQVLGETWVNHHGDHGKEGTRALLNGLEVVGANPLLTGVKDIWGPSDVYGIGNPLAGSTILLLGQPTLGMQASDGSNIHKSLMPVAWTRNYQLPGGKQGQAFTTTMGASVDFANADFRRLIVNACFQGLGFQEDITSELNIDLVGEYHPTMFGFGKHKPGLFPKDYK